MKNPENETQAEIAKSKYDDDVFDAEKQIYSCLEEGPEEGLLALRDHIDKVIMGNASQETDALAMIIVNAAANHSTRRRNDPFNLFFKEAIHERAKKVVYGIIVYGMSV